MSLSHFKNLIKIVSTMSLLQHILKIFKANYSSNVVQMSYFSARFRYDQYKFIYKSTIRTKYILYNQLLKLITGNRMNFSITAEFLIHDIRKSPTARILIGFQKISDFKKERYYLS